MTDRPRQNVACDGVLRVWHRDRVVPHMTQANLPMSMDGVVASRSFASVASEMHRRDLLQVAQVKETSKRPLVDVIKSIDGIRLPLMPVRA